MFLIDERGAVTHTERDDLGIMAAAGRFDALMAELRGRFPGLPLLLGGMVGSNRGWHEAAYTPCPADIAALAANILWVEPGMIGIVPGVARDDDDHPDVMRGEEIQVLGAVAAGMVAPDALLCQPGTHNKWVTIEAGRITMFVTAMAGEVYALLRDHSLLGGMMTGEVIDGAAFADGVATARDRRDLLGSLFGARAAVLLGRRAEADIAAYVSGLVIGTDVAAHVPKGATVAILADGLLGELYNRAIGLVGAEARHISSHEAFVAGMRAIAAKVLA